MSNLLAQSCLRQFARGSLGAGAAAARSGAAFALPLRTQSFSTTSPTQSRKGGAPITVPPEVSLKFIDLPVVAARGNAQEAPKVAIEVKGPLGELTLRIPPFVTVEHDEALRKATLSVQDAEIKHQRAMWGTMRAHLQNYILGVSEGHICILSMVGVGYRAMIESTATTVEPEFPGQQFVSLKVGYSHPIELPIPKGVKASTPQPTRILLESVDKEVVTQFAAEIREWRKPEPYKGKGIFVNGETIRLKAKKIR
ncbi:mitochondrial 54S ribosomal protein uL6m [Aspergillus saccharolyticus JOP 1030-1]|uniref:Large ribosomal subunit protein uL6m n=1 Tax=Aspergillus saccharolyticus JOP 1030-1 TaxID=1450539 RepID=A0A318Z9T4_9EURO|nr:putative mitochondrial 54S ribosomal protein YmL16 [Aspergillus saccharolyticus JOP 1030-1]PYH44126.1 putative mitochondrial 54S ribosomal protein YmL16 [Aspergillus saccharolyticus JOP 1030-1]